jgi:hypothetical protein
MNSASVRTVSVVCALLSACGTGSIDLDASAQGVIVTIAPAAVALGPGQGQPFSAAVTGTVNTAVSWSVAEGAAGGTVDSTGYYVAPASLGTYHVVVASVADPSKRGDATVTVATPSPTDPGALIPSDRRTLWQPGVTYNGGIPFRTTISATLSPRGGTLDDSAQIQAALDACPAGQVVKLNPGTFRINSSGLYPRSNTTLRGSGPGVTTMLSVTGNDPILTFGRRWYQWTNQVNLTADAVVGTYSATIATNPGLAAGQTVVVNEAYDPALTVWGHSAQRTDPGDYLGWGEGRKGSYANARPIGQVMEIVSVTGSGPYVVTFSTPFHMTWRTARTAHIARMTGGNGTDTAWAGVEDLTLLRGAGSDDDGGISFNGGAKYCWAKHIETDQSGASAVRFKGSFRCELRDSYIHSTANPMPGGGGYGVAVDSYAADNLIENNVIWNFNKVTLCRSSGGGNVFGYNYAQDSWGEGYPTLPETGINASHMATPHHELFEGNESHTFGSDFTWGNSIYITVFRNSLTGLRTSYAPLRLADQGNRRAAEVNPGGYWFTYVGNVLGFQGMPLNAAMPYGNSGQTAWTYERTDAQGNSYAAMWQFNDADALASSRILRMGNFDWATQSQRWHGLGGNGTPNSVPSPLPAIPNSLYISIKPSFMGANPWPWVDPATGLTHTLPAKARFVAGTPNALP